MRISYPKSDHLLSSLMRQAWFKCEMPQLELKSSGAFLHIKLCEQTKSQKVIKQSRSLLKKVAHMCTTSGKDVKDLDPCNMANTSKLFIYKLFDNLQMLWMWILMHSYHVTTTTICQASQMLPRIMDAPKQETKKELYSDWGLRPILYGNHINIIHI